MASTSKDVAPSDKTDASYPMLFKVCSILIFAVVAAVFLAFALVDFSLQPNAYARERLLGASTSSSTSVLVSDSDDDDNADTPTIFTAAFLFAGTLNWAAYAFGGIILAFFVSRQYDYQLHYGQIRRGDVAIILVAGIVALVALIAHWVLEEVIRHDVQIINSLSLTFGPDDDDDDDLPDSLGFDDEEDLKYPMLWAASPFVGRSKYVYGAMVFMCIAIVIQMIYATVVACVDRKAASGRGGRNRFETTTATVVSIFHGISFLLAVVLVIGTLLIVAFGVHSTHFWLCMNAAPMLSLAFFYTGWTFYFSITKSWYFRPSTDLPKRGSNARVWARIALFVTLAVGITAVVFGVVHLVRTFTKCSDDEISTMTDLKEGVCSLIDKERESTEVPWIDRSSDSVCNFYKWTTLAYVVVLGLSVIVLLVSTFVYCYGNYNSENEEAEKMLAQGETPTEAQLKIQRMETEARIANTRHNEFTRMLTRRNAALGAK